MTVRAIVFLAGLWPVMSMAQTACPVPADMATGVRVIYLPDFYSDYRRDPDLPGGILSESFAAGRLAMVTAMAGGHYETSILFDETGSGEMVPLMDSTYDAPLEVPVPDVRWTIGVSVESHVDDNDFSEVRSYVTGPIETISFGGCPVRVFSLDFARATDPVYTFRLTYLVDFGFVVASSPESQDPASLDYDPIRLEAL